MGKFKISITSMLLLLTITNITSCSTTTINQNHSNSNNTIITNSNDAKIAEIESSLDKLANAKTITVKKDLISLNNSYSIKLDDEDFGSVSGKYVNITGDKFSLKDESGNILLSEKQIKRWGVKLNRLAEVYDHNNNVIGYIGEEKIEDLFKVGYTFHFYDKDKNEIASSNQKFFSLLDTFKIYDNDKNLCFEINEEFTLVYEKYTITVHDNSTISSGEAILLTTILNAIRNANKK